MIRRDPPKKHATAFVVAVAWASALFYGCATTNLDHDESELPWNTPQSWEGAPSIPGLSGDR